MPLTGKQRKALNKGPYFAQFTKINKRRHEIIDEAFSKYHWKEVNEKLEKNKEYQAIRKKMDELDIKMYPELAEFQRKTARNMRRRLNYLVAKIKKVRKRIQGEVA